MTPAMTLLRRLSPRLVALILATILSALLPGRAVASEHAAPKPAGGHEKADDKEGGHETAADKPLRTDVFELGEFKIRNTLPTHHVTVQIQFSVSLILSSTTTLADVHALQKWQQRVRDQTIIAVRSADPADFADPQLRRLRRLIMLRLHRLPTPAKIIGVYLTDFAVDKAD